jgi:hypothetical protein
MEVQGYSPVLILILLGVGIPLAVVRPYRALLLALTVVTAGNVPRFNQTRLPGLGPFFNMADACLLVMAAAFFFDRIARKKPVRIPQVVGLLILVIGIGAIQSIWKLGWTYETLRAFRWALELPVSIFLGANLVTSSRRAKFLIAALLCANTLSVAQHLLFVVSLWHTMSLTMENYAAMRTIAYGGLSGSFLLTAVVWKPPATRRKRGLLLALGVLYLTGLFLNQTRSLWLVLAGAVPCLMILFRVRFRLRQVLMYCLLLYVVGTGLAYGMRRAMPGIDPVRLVQERFGSLLNPNTRSGSQTATRSREFDVEMSQWFEGTLVFGRGLYFFQTIENRPEGGKYIAFGHLGYVTYLAQLGLVGLIVYGFYLPLSVIRDGRSLWWRSGSPAVRYLGLLGTASMVHLWIGFLVGSNLLGAGTMIIGVIYGSMWGMARQVASVHYAEALETLNTPTGEVAETLVRGCI